jgi:hypothetical protein
MKRQSRAKAEKDRLAIADKIGQAVTMLLDYGMEHADDRSALLGNLLLAIRQEVLKLRGGSIV